MAKGTSGRIVIEVDPNFKQELYEALKKEEMTLKEWFLRNADTFLKNKSQLSLLSSDYEGARRAV